MTTSAKDLTETSAAAAAAGVLAAVDSSLAGVPGLSGIFDASGGLSVHLLASTFLQFPLFKSSAGLSMQLLGSPFLLLFPLDSSNSRAVFELAMSLLGCGTCSPAWLWQTDSC